MNGYDWAVGVVFLLGVATGVVLMAFAQGWLS